MERSVASDCPAMRLGGGPLRGAISEALRGAISQAAREADREALRFDVGAIFRFRVRSFLSLKRIRNRGARSDSFLIFLQMLALHGFVRWAWAGWHGRRPPGRGR